MIEILIGDCREVLKTLESESVQCCVTSPPFYGLRDYGTTKWEGGSPDCKHIKNFRPQRGHNGRDFGEQRGREPSKEATAISYRGICGLCGAQQTDSQLGLEKTPEEYVAQMVAVFREVKRVLRKDGTLWLNLGDSYNGSRESPSNDGVTSTKQASNQGAYRCGNVSSLKVKDLIGIPWRVAFALQADGWWLRCDCIWNKPNVMPSSQEDRPTRSHEYVFLLTKSRTCFYDHEAVLQPYTSPLDRWGGNNLKANGTSEWDEATGQEIYRNRNMRPNPLGKTLRSVWTVPTSPYPEAHFATYPPDLIKPCIMAGSRVGDTRFLTRSEVREQQARSQSNSVAKQS